MFILYNIKKEKAKLKLIQVPTILNKNEISRKYKYTFLLGSICISVQNSDNAIIPLFIPLWSVWGGVLFMFCLVLYYFERKGRT